MSLDGRGSVRAHRLSLTRTSLKSFARVYDDKSVEDCLSVNQIQMKPIDEEMKQAKEYGRNTSKIQKMLDQSEHRPPAYFVYNSTQSSDGSPRKTVDVKKVKKSDYAALGKKLAEE